MWNSDELSPIGAQIGASYVASKRHSSLDEEAVFASSETAESREWHDKRLIEIDDRLLEAVQAVLSVSRASAAVGTTPALCGFADATIDLADS